jgi:FkbM family methyltransferase
MAGLGSALRRRLVRRPRAYALLRRVKITLRHLARRPHEPDFAGFALFPQRAGGLFLDVGANSGQSALAFRLYNRRSPILALEPNPALAADLRWAGRLIRGFEFMVVAAGPEPGEATLYVPSIGQVEISGEASLLPSDDPAAYWQSRHLERGGAPLGGAAGERRVRVDVVRVDDLRVAPAFVKIDVEGYALGVLQGMERTLRDHRPVVLAEVGDEGDALVAWLDERGFEAKIYEPASRSLRPPTASAQNLFFVPRGEPDRAPSVGAG